jgi:hypothetical protein
VTAADASSPSFPHLARGCPRARRRPWRGIRGMRAFLRTASRCGPSGSRERCPRVPGAAAGRAPRRSYCSTAPDVSGAAAVPGTYTRRERSSTLRVVQTLDGSSPSACRAASRRPYDGRREASSRPASDMSTGDGGNPAPTRPVLIRNAEPETAAKAGVNRKGSKAGRRIGHPTSSGAGPAGCTQPAPIGAHAGLTPASTPRSNSRSSASTRGRRGGGPPRPRTIDGAHRWASAASGDRIWSWGPR